nr:MAG TPA: protein of unknown function DUF1799 [Caudoviricetes sp.]
MGAPTELLLEGLDYTGVEIVMRRQGVPAERGNEVFGQVQIMEHEMLRVVNAREMD